MKTYNIEFVINPTTKFIINLEEPLHAVHCCYDVSVTLIHEDRIFDAIKRETVDEIVNNFKCFAEEALRNELQLHESITQDLGLLFNEDCQFKPGLFQVPNPAGFWWVGNRYALTTANKLATWLYNDSQGTIIFEATPIFPFSYRNHKKDPNYVPYWKWIKTYKPYFITEASRECIESWITKANPILKQIEENNIRMQREWEEYKKATKH
jgi:hypothetical protein